MAIYFNYNYNKYIYIYIGWDLTYYSVWLGWVLTLVWSFVFDIIALFLFNVSQ
jgi:hypothetical protein